MKLEIQFQGYESIPWDCDINGSPFEVESEDDRKTIEEVVRWGEPDPDGFIAGESPHGESFRVRAIQ